MSDMLNRMELSAKLLIGGTNHILNAVRLLEAGELGGAVYAINSAESSTANAQAVLERGIDVELTFPKDPCPEIPSANELYYKVLRIDARQRALSERLYQCGHILKANGHN